MIQLFTLILLCTLLMPTTADASDYYGKRRASSGTSTPINSNSDYDMSDSNRSNADSEIGSEDEEVASITKKIETVNTSPAKRPNPGKIDWNKPYCPTALADRAAHTNRSGIATILSQMPKRIQSKSTSPVASYSVTSEATPVALRMDSTASMPKTPLSAKTPSNTATSMFSPTSMFSE